MGTVGPFHTPRAGDWKPNPTGRGAHAAKTGSLPEQVAYEIRCGSMRVERMAGHIGCDRRENRTCPTGSDMRRKA